MIDNITLIAQSAIRIKDKNNTIIYFDPFKIDNSYKNDADYIFITHPHYDHFSEDDILKVRKQNTKIIAPIELKAKIKDLGFTDEYILQVIPNNNYKIDNIDFCTVPAYNLNKDFHKKEYGWVGYLVNIDKNIVYVAGDTDNIEEIRNIKCDIACVPIGGKYTMTCEEAVDLIKEIKPKTAIPIHYKTVVGTVEYAYKFKELLEDITNVEILMK